MDLSEFKLEVHFACRKLLETKLANLQQAMNDAKESLSAEAKSSAGDKHETGRAMLQLEMEKLGLQLKQAQQSQ